MQDQLVHLAHMLGQMRGVPIRGLGALHASEEQVEPGLGTLMLEDPYLPPRRWALQVPGDTLQDDHICANDYVVIDLRRLSQAGTLVAVSMNDRVTIEHYTIVPEISLLETVYPEAQEAAASPPQILGVVYAVVRLLQPRRPTLQAWITLMGEGLHGHHDGEQKVASRQLGVRTKAARNLVVGQSGGPTAVINASLAGVIAAALAADR